MDHVDEQAPGRRHVALSSAWPASFALLALAVALAMAALVGGIVLAVTRLAGGVAAGENNPTGVLAATAVQDVVFVGTAVALGSLAGRVTKADLGLGGRPLGRVLRVTALTGAAFLAFSVVYDLIVRPDAQQDTLDDLGADRGTIWLFLTGLLVVGLAPFAEELLFRGFMYRCLRNRFSPLMASVGVGLLFGAVHFDGAAVLPLLPILAVFGALLCAMVALWQSIERLINPQSIDHLWPLAAAGVIGFIGNEIAAQIRTRAGKRLDSPALIADGAHARTDGFVSLSVVASAIVLALGLEIGDPIIGLIITVVILRITWQSFRTVQADPGDPDAESEHHDDHDGPGLAARTSSDTAAAGHGHAH